MHTRLEGLHWNLVFSDACILSVRARVRAGPPSGRDRSRSGAARALLAASTAGRCGRFHISPHAAQRMRERNATRADVQASLLSATVALQEGPDRWQLDGGRDLEGEGLLLVVALAPRCVIVTVY